MIETLLGIIVAVLVLSLVIIIHELGHFLAARRAGILCHEFSLGMGPILWSKRKGETLYCVRAIPLGGYVAMAGEEVEDEIVKVGHKIRIVTEGNIIQKIILDHENPKFEEYELITVNKVDLKGVDGGSLYINEFEVKRDAFYVMKKMEIQIAPADRNFNYKNKKQRFLAIFGGPFMNFVLAFFVFVLYGFLSGFPNVDSSVISTVTPGMPAYDLLQVDDEIIAINGEEVLYWQNEDSTSTVSDLLNKYMSDRMVTITVLRDVDGTQTELDLDVTPIIYFYSLGFHSQEQVLCTTSDITDGVLAASGTPCTDGAVKVQAAINTLTIGSVPEGTQAYSAVAMDTSIEGGLQQGDQLVSIDGHDVFTWADVINRVPAYTQEDIDNLPEGDELEVTIVVDRDGDLIEYKLSNPWTQEVMDQQGYPMVNSMIGIAPTYEFHFFKSIEYGVVGIGNSLGAISSTLGLLFGSSQVGVGDLAGPVGIYSITASAFSQGFVALLGWIGLLSVNLGFLNLLPIPALDGGRLVFLGIEAVGLKVDTKWENRVHYIMYLLLLGLFVFITFNDISRLIESIF